MSGQPDQSEYDALALLRQELGARPITETTTASDDDDKSGSRKHGMAKTTLGWLSRPEDVPGLREVIVSVYRKSSRRLNPLVILCPSNHVLGRVYRTADCGLVLVGFSAERDRIGGRAPGCDSKVVHRRGAERQRIAVLLDATDESCEFRVGCRCQQVWLTTEQVNDLLATPGAPHRIRIEATHGEERGHTVEAALLPHGVRRQLRREDP